MYFVNDEYGTSTPAVYVGRGNIVFPFCFCYLRMDPLLYARVPRHRDQESRPIIISQGSTILITIVRGRKLN
jgi:hypothetical protein